MKCPMCGAQLVDGEGIAFYIQDEGSDEPYWEPCHKEKECKACPRGCGRTHREYNQGMWETFIVGRL